MDFRRRKPSFNLFGFLMNIVMLFAVICTAIVLFVNVRYTACFVKTGKMVIQESNLFSCIAMFLVGLAIFFILCLMKLKIGKKAFYIISMIYLLFTIVAIISLKIFPIDDQYYMTWIAANMIKGEYSQFEPYGYICLYPFQYFYMRYVKFLFELFGVNNYIAVQIINAIFLWLFVIYTVKITRFLFGEEKYLIGIILMLFLPLTLFTTYIYGTIPALALSSGAIYFLLKFLNKEGKLWINIGLIVVMNTFAMLMKTNASIFTIAQLCVITLYSIKSKEKKKFFYNGVLAILIVVFYYACSFVVNRSMYTYTYSDDIGTPKISWIAMGMQEGGIGCGWNNFYNRDVYWDNDLDRTVATAESKESIKKSIEYFADHPQYLYKFYENKICSEWTNPSFEALSLMQTSFERNRDDAIVYPAFIEEHVLSNTNESLDVYHRGLNRFLKAYILIILGGTLVYLCIHPLREHNCILYIVFIGGFLFHIFWEGGSQYVMNYFVMLIPYGIEGMSALCNLLYEKIQSKVHII